MTNAFSLPLGSDGESAPVEEEVELFRRALGGGDEAACERLVALHRRLVLSWIRRVPGAGTVPADEDDRVVRTFERFWLALRERRHEDFANLAALLGYLRMCAASVVLDDARQVWGREGQTLSLDAIGEAIGNGAADFGEDTQIEARVAARAERRELWATVERVLPDAAQRRVVYLRFAVGLTPREIHERYPDDYRTVADVYRVKRRALLRLRRCRQLRPFR